MTTATSCNGCTNASCTLRGWALMEGHDPVTAIHRFTLPFVPISYNACHVVKVREEKVCVELTKVASKQRVAVRNELRAQIAQLQRSVLFPLSSDLRVQFTFFQRLYACSGRPVRWDADVWLEARKFIQDCCTSVLWHDDEQAQDAISAKRHHEGSVFTRICVCEG